MGSVLLFSKICEDLNQSIKWNQLLLREFISILGLVIKSIQHYIYKKGFLDWILRIYYYYSHIIKRLLYQLCLYLFQLTLK